MKFCMLTSFFGSHSFGGDSVYIERLCQALLQRGHEVHVVYSQGAFESVRGRTCLRPYQPPEGLVEHPLDIGRWSGKLNVLWSHQTAGAGRNTSRLRQIFEREAFDVLHLHNVSLLGGRGVPRLASTFPKAVKLLTAHDYWWICPRSLLWRISESPCRSRACFVCNLRQRKPPQLWRRDGWFNGALSGMDAILFPSRCAMQTHETMGMNHGCLRVLPGLLPEGWEDGARNPPRDTPDWLPARPFIASAGRMVVEKGFQTVIPLMRHVPGVDLVIAGDGPLRKELQRMARGIPNVKFAGLRSNQDVRLLFQRARSVLVPSLFPETFGLVVAEALTSGTRVIARRVGSIPEVTAASPDAMLFDSETELLALLQKVAAESAESHASAGGGLLNPPPTWFEEGHLKEYLGLIDEIRDRRQAAAPR